MSLINHTLRSVPGQLKTPMDTQNSLPPTPPPAPSPPTPTPRPLTTVCPYCGHINAGTSACDRCKGLFEPLSRQASQNSMGPWFVRDETNPFLPGCSFQTLRVLISRGRVVRTSILRGPSTRQFWTFARNAPGVANLLGECHACHAEVSPTDSRCASCGASFEVLNDRERLGLSEVRLLPGHAAPEQIAAASAMPQADSPRQSRPGSDQTSALPVVGRDDPVEAQALIAARQRQRRSRQRQTIAVVLLVLALVCVGAAIAFVVTRPRPGSNAPAAAGSVPLPPAAPSRQPEPQAAEPGTSPADPEKDVNATPPEDADDLSSHEIESLLRDLSSPDLQTVRAALERAHAIDPEPNQRLAAAIQAAVTRINLAKIGQRL